MRKWIPEIVVIAAVVALFGITPSVLGFPPPDLPTLLGSISYMLLICVSLGLLFTLATEYTKRALRNKIIAEAGAVAVLSFLAVKYWAMPSLAALATDPPSLFQYDFDAVGTTILFMALALFDIAVDVV
ncbi:MAG: hypothetical protein ACP5UD_07555, partial [Conexivisphaera sp.]